MPTSVQLDSSCLSSARYSDDATLDVVFVHGSAYRYFDVPASVFHLFLAADSKGTFLNREIKPRFRFERLS